MVKQKDLFQRKKKNFRNIFCLREKDICKIFGFNDGWEEKVQDKEIFLQDLGSVKNEVVGI